jgi:hypothetical protein
MKNFLQSRLFLGTIVLTILALFAFSSCKKDQTCRVKVTVTDTLGTKQRFMWVILDIPENTPPSQTGNAPSDVFPLQLNTKTDGFVEAEFKLPAIIQANIYDSVDVQFINPLKKTIIKLEAGETVSEVVEVQ